MLKNAQLEFDRRFAEKGDRVLKAIFRDKPELRDLISLKSPRECHHHEVVFCVNYETPQEFSSILSLLCNWLEQESNQMELEDLMLF